MDAGIAGEKVKNVGIGTQHLEVQGCKGQGIMSLYHKGTTPTDGTIIGAFELCLRESIAAHI